ncbi:MAG TPA: hypothetical protein VFH37_01785 [Candidatus Saccharimonadales bacterium]|nr:hypothetical protein [Candidatus Saccharimonadales bacterium]
MRREKAVSGPLPVYSWLNIEEPKPETEITSESFQAQVNPDEFEEAQERMWAEEAERAAAAKRARTAASSAEESIATAERTTLTEVININQTEAWPGQAAIESGVSYSQLENLLEPTESKVQEAQVHDAQVIYVEEKRAMPEKSPHFYSQLAKAGLLNAMERMTAVRTPEVDLKKYAKIGGKALTAAKVTTQKNYESLSDWVKEKNVPKFNKRTVIVAGSLALAAAAVGIEFYMGHKGATVHNSSPAQETVNGHTSDSLISPKEFTVPLQAQAVVAQVGHHAHRAHEVLLQAGDGYTQVIQKLFPNRSPAQYLEAYKEAVSQLGPSFIKHAAHYRMSNGDYGLSGHKADVSQKTFNFLAKALRANR